VNLLSGLTIRFDNMLYLEKKNEELGVLIFLQIEEEDEELI
jgi:hypothetical protein